MTTKKFIAKNGLQSQNVDFVSPNGSSTLSFSMSDTGTLSVSGTAAGQLFSITDSLSGVIHSVNNASGVPSFEVYDTGEVRLAEYGGNVGFGVANPTDKVHIGGNLRITGALKDSANSAGTSGYILSSTGSGTQWITVPSTALTGDVTGTGSGSISTTLANSGVTAGTYKSVTVDVKGRVTSGTNPTTLSGYGITDAQPLDADLTAIAALTGTSGFLKKTAADTWSLDTNSYLTGNQTITLSGDVTGSGSTAITATLANSGVTAGSYTLASITVDAKGRVTAASSGTAGASLTGLTQDSGNFITSLGAGAGQSGTGGAVTIGYQAGQSNSYGGGGVHIGYQAGKASIGGNITIGNSAGVALGYGPYCTIIGTGAGTTISSATSTTIIGGEAGKQCGNVDNLTAIGTMSGFYAGGNGSTLLGSRAGYYSGGVERVALGFYSMRGSPNWDTTGGYSVGVGAYSLFSYTSGEKNVAIGHSALYSATTSKWNVAIGHNAGYGLTTASDNNVIIGYLAGYTGTNNLTSSATNNILIGASAQASSSSATNEITLGNSSITRLRIPGLGIDWTSATVPTGGGGGGTSITNTIVTTTTQTAAKDNRYILTNASATTVTLPATPTLGDTVYIIVANGLTTNVIARNGSPIMGLAEDLTVDGSTASFGLFYVNSTLGWRII